MAVSRPPTSSVVLVALHLQCLPEWKNQTYQPQEAKFDHNQRRKTEASFDDDHVQQLYTEREQGKQDHVSTSMMGLPEYLDDTTRTVMGSNWPPATAVERSMVVGSGSYTLRSKRSTCTKQHPVPSIPSWLSCTM